MKKTLITLLTAFSLAAALTATTALAQNTAKHQAARQEKGERHPKIRQAIRALEAARTDLQNAAHDFCGHRVEALEATNSAIKQLQLALGSDRAAVEPAPGLQLASYQPETSASGVAAQTGGQGGKQGGERHPMIRRAINALEAAKDDLEHAATDFHGHKAEALEATHRALNQLHAALACDKK